MILNRNLQNKIQSIKPRIYKKSLYFGKKPVFKFTRNYASKFFSKLITWIFLVVLLSSIIIGGVGIFINR